MKTLHFLRNTVLSYIGNAVFMQVQNCCKKYKPIDSNMIWKRQLLYNNLKQKENVESKVGELNARKGWFDNFSERTGLKNVKTGEAASADHRAADEGQKLLRKSRGRKNVCLNRFLMQMKVSYSGEKKNATKGFYQKGRSGSRTEGRKGGVTPVLHEICPANGQNCPHPSSCWPPALKGEDGHSY